MTTTSDLRELTAEALKGKTLAEGRVYSARTWPTWSGLYPVIILGSPTEDMEGLGRAGAPQYTVTTTLRVVARVQVPERPNGAGAAVAQLMLERIQRQVKQAVINNPAIMGRLQQIPFVRSQFTEPEAGDKVLAELVMDVGMEFYQGPEEFYPLEGEAATDEVDAAAEIAAIQAIVDLENVTVTNDLANVFDPSGTYADPAFPSAVLPAPRDSGPDGRGEGGFSIDFPQ